MRPRWEVADVLRIATSKFINLYNPPFHIRKAIEDILNCRTALKGGHQSICTKCGKTEIAYNSCRNRSCPKCEGHKQAKWVEEREKELLPLPYFHVVFTLPHELNSLIIKNREEYLNILFKAVSETLLQISKTKFNGLAGFFCILHSWGSNLQLHPQSL